jgi:hypothetical protein
MPFSWFQGSGDPLEAEHLNPLFKLLARGDIDGKLSMPRF